MSNGDIHGEGRGCVVTGPALGGPPGHAIHPARDAGPCSDWTYIGIPVVGPPVGGVLSGLIFTAAF
ncbi:MULTISPECIES: hypothetical protein [unclassified Streptomyces]|uniref:hypothetical protein n=1 Tax=unclassified Streptomyces TaxID=2593676 RepID=UPI0038705BAA